MGQWGSLWKPKSWWWWWWWWWITINNTEGTLGFRIVFPFGPCILVDELQHVNPALGLVERFRPACNSRSHCERRSKTVIIASSVIVFDWHWWQETKLLHSSSMMMFPSIFFLKGVQLLTVWGYWRDGRNWDWNHSHCFRLTLVPGHKIQKTKIKLSQGQVAVE